MSFSVYLDEHVDTRLADMLRAAGCDALTALDAGRAHKAITDENQLAFAAENGRAIFTYNIRDFVPLASSWDRQGRHHTGVILSRREATPILYRGFLRLFESHPDGIPDLVLWLPLGS